MPYATVTDLQDRLGVPALVQLGDLTDPPSGAVDATVVQKALDDASAEIDGYLVGRYPLPLPVAVPALRVHCVTLAHYRLLGNRADEVIREDVKAARAFLDRVSSGAVNLTAPVDAPALGGIGPVLFNPGSKVMGREGNGSCGNRGRGLGWCADGMSLPALLADYLFVGPLIKARLDEKVAGFPVDVVETVDQVLASDRRTHVLMVMYAGDNFGDVASVRSRIVVQRWLVLVAFNNVGAAASARQVKAGPVMSQVHVALAGWKPEGAVHSLRRANAAMRPGFPAGKALYPLGFELELSL